MYIVQLDAGFPDRPCKTVAQSKDDSISHLQRPWFQDLFEKPSSGSKLRCTRRQRKTDKSYAYENIREHSEWPEAVFIGNFAEHKVACELHEKVYAQK